MSNVNDAREQYSNQLKQQQEQESLAIQTLQLLQQLQANDVQVTFLGHTLTDKSLQHIVALHKDSQIDIAKTVAALTVIADKGTTQLELDIAQLISNNQDIAANLDDLTDNSNEAKDVVLYGFGRIGRILTRLLMSRPASDKGLQLKAVVIRPAKAGDLQKRACLLKQDSVHAEFNGSVEVDEERNGLVINGRFVQFIYAKSPNDIDYNSYGIDNALIIDNTGIWTDNDSLGQHLESKGVDKVLLTAPASGTIKNIVYNVNNDTIGDDNLVSAASCTTNAITPTLNVLNEEFGIETGHVETIHSYTNDQNLIDNYHKKDRRGRSAGLNMVITSTGAAKAVGKALPELSGKLTGNAIRVPTPNVSMAILNLNLKKAPADAAELNAYLKQIAESNKWQAQIAYTDSTEAVSTDFIGAQQVGIIDAQATIVTNNHATIYIWYDNEVGYSTQVIRVATQMAGVSYQKLG